MKILWLGFLALVVIYFPVVFQTGEHPKIYLPVVMHARLGRPVVVTFHRTSNDDLAFPIVEQPFKLPAWVSDEPNEWTYFRLAEDYGSIGLLAHNHLAGKYVNVLGRGSHITLIDIHGQSRLYTVVDFKEYQAVSPQDTGTNFWDLRTGELKTVSQVFLETFGVADRLVLQTSINRFGVESWGRLFVIAIPDSVLNVEPVRND